MNNTELEIWKDIKDYEGLYQVSNMGRVKSLNYHNTKEERILKQNIVRGYYQVCFSVNKKRKYYRVNRLVAQAFLPNPNNYPCVNHKDENPKNNIVSNLEWCDVKYNINYGTRNKRIGKTIRRKRIIKHYILEQIRYLNELKAYKKKLKQLIK